jgi:hypothetical protein
VGEGQNARGILASIFEFSANCKAAAALADHPARQSLGASFQGVDTNLQLISEALHAIAAIRQSDVPEPINWWLLQSDIDTRVSLLKDHLTKVRKWLRILDEALFRFSELGQINPTEWWGPKPWNLATLERVAGAALQKTNSLPGWLVYQRAVRDVKAAKLTGIAKLAESKAIAVSELVPAYTYAFYNTLTQQLTKERSQLLQFSGLGQEAVRGRFVQYDNDLIKLNRDLAALQTNRRSSRLLLATVLSANGPSGR